MKNKNYVALMLDNSVRYITHVDNSDKTALWSPEKPALAMSRSSAEDLYFGLRCNGYKAVVITMPSYEEPRNPGEEANQP